MGEVLRPFDGDGELLGLTNADVVNEKGGVLLLGGDVDVGLAVGDAIDEVDGLSDGDVVG